MEFITSRSFELPSDAREMEAHEWFNIWKRRLFPYEELIEGDILYWFDRIHQQLVWKTNVVETDRFPFSKKREILSRYPEAKSSDYYQKADEPGYFLGYKVRVIEALDLQRPSGFILPRSGWLRVDETLANVWFGRPNSEEEPVLDKLTNTSPTDLKKILELLSEKMKNMSTQRVKRLVETTIRRDTPIVKALKMAKGYRCEFPECGHRIPNKSGGYYIEVAHIEAVAKGGKSVLGNLLVLCPNHHKEFDHGNLQIDTQSETLLKGTLNGLPFRFEF